MKILLLNLKKLDKILAKGKQILQLIEICSKYETEREKVQSFKTHSTAEEEKPAEEQQDETLKDFKEVQSPKKIFQIS